jgi:hypothetical protein
MIIRDDITIIKTKLDDIETKFQEQMKEFEEREEVWSKLEQKVTQIIEGRKNKITINVGGTIFKTSKQTLLSIKDNFFTKALTAENFDQNKELYIERSPKFFNIILNYLRGQEVKLKYLGKYQIELLHDEVKYYELNELDEQIVDFLTEIHIINMEISAPFKHSNANLTSNTLKDVIMRDTSTGVTTTSPGWIIFELDKEWEFNEIEVCGLSGNKNWSVNSGANSKVWTSPDKASWCEVGTLPGNIQTFQKVKLRTKEKARFIKITHTAQLGLSYLYVFKPDHSNLNS